VCAGGNVSTNAGGLRLLRYGSLHGSVLGLEVVLPDGRVLDLLRTLRKDNTGLDLKQLFIGAEGALGVVTAVSLLAPPRPTSVQVAFLALSDFPAVLATLARARAQLGEVLSACEFLDRESLELCVERLEGARDPLPESSSAAAHYMVVETSGSNAEHDRAKLDAFLESALEAGDVLDGTVAADTAQARALWRLREGVTEALVKAGAVYKYDISMPQVRRPERRKKREERWIDPSNLHHILTRLPPHNRPRVRAWPTGAHVRAGGGHARAPARHARGGVRPRRRRQSPPQRLFAARPRPCHSGRHRAVCV
jgi:D-2-hydroxyglutarate dehydrogenase